MKVVSVEEINLNSCLREAQQEQIVLTREGEPVALIVGVEGLDLDQILLGQSDKFWTLIKERRQQPTVSWEEMEKQLGIIDEA